MWHDTIRFGIICVVTGCLLWGNADNFDETEIKTIVEIAVLGSIGIGGEQLFHRVFPQKAKEGSTKEGEG